MKPRFNPQLIIALLSEAMQHFGPPGEWNQPVVTHWLRERVRGITGEGPPLETPSWYEPGEGEPADVVPFPTRETDDWSRFGG